MSDQKIQEYYKKKAEEKQVEYDELSKQRLLVKFGLSSPFSSVSYINLDGILAYFSLQELIGEDFHNIDASPVDPIDAPLPIEQGRNDDGKWWWLCSFGCYVLQGESITGWKKRWDDKHDFLVDFPEKRKPRIDHKSGFFKAYAMPLIIRNTKEIVFCCIGNAARIEELLANCWGIGKKRSQGYGRLDTKKVEETSGNWHSWNEKREATRAIPVATEEIKKQISSAALQNRSFAMVTTGYKPPYWHPQNRAYCHKIGEVAHADINLSTESCMQRHE